MLPYAKEQEKALAEALRNSAEFRCWFLGHTKFANCVTEAVLIRHDNPWYTSRKTGRQSETDVLAVFREVETGAAFAIHIENKRKGDRFQPDQPELYQERANDWKDTEKWGNYSDFQCVLIATNDFLARNSANARKFDVIISSEAVAVFLAEFRDESPLDVA